MSEYTLTPVFDWYAATVDEFPDVLASDVCDALSVTQRRARGLHGYSAGTDFYRGNDVVAKMIYGGDQAPHIWASGVDAQDLANVLRSGWLNTHYLTRVDVALDFTDGSPWDDLYGHAVTVADFLPSGDRRSRPLKLATVGDWVRKDEGYPGGRTLYVGSMKSPVFARLYEKGKQMRALYPDQLDKYPIGWVRAEVQVRPQGEARKSLATMEPAAIWGASRWSTDLYERIVGSPLVAVKVQQSRPADDERAYRFLLRQYGGLLRRRVDAMPPGIDRLEAYAELGRELGRALG